MAPLSTSSLWQLTLMRLREFYREPEAVFWTFAFPLLLAGGLAVAFREKAPDPTVVAVVDDGSVAARALVTTLTAAASSAALIVKPVSPERAERASQTEGAVLVVAARGDSVSYRFDPLQPDAPLARARTDALLQRARGRQDVVPVRDITVREPGSRYIDFFIPGLLAMNLMGSSIWSLVFAIVQQRKNKLLKRFVATPMSRTEYLASFVLARLCFLVLEVGVLLAIGTWVLGVPVRGSLVTLGAVSLVGAAAFGGIGLLIAARTRTIEAASGLSNFVMLPMWILSGVFFSAARFPAAVQPFVNALPLTALVNATRAVMLQGASLQGVGGELLLLAAYGAVSLVLALRLFRWQ